MSCSGDLADIAQLQRLAVLLYTALGAVFGECPQSQPDLGLLLGRGRLRERRNGQIFGLAIAARAVEQPDGFGDQ